MFTSDAACAVLNAVACLSPVNNQILIPAHLNVAIAVGTPSCNLSSTAVNPANIKSISIPVAASEIASSRLSSEFAAT